MKGGIVGRPKTDSKNLSLTVPEDVYKALIREAAKEQRSLSNMTAILVREALNTRREGGR